MIFKIHKLSNTSVLFLHSIKDAIEIEPSYQRRGGIWNLEKKQLLIDSIINGFDIPKLYLHDLRSVKQRLDKRYAIIDGRQRLETIWEFIEGKIALADDFEYLHDGDLRLNGLNYSDLGRLFPKIKLKLDSYDFPVIVIETTSEDIIEDMFSRLNEAVPLNAAEKRNAIGGSMARMIARVSERDFFRKKVAFSDRRFQHREVAARLLFIEMTLQESSKIFDTKKPYLDKMVRDFKMKLRKRPSTIGNPVMEILDSMNRVFLKRDVLLQSQSIVPIYYLLFRNTIDRLERIQIGRTQLLEFKKQLKVNRDTAKRNITEADFDFLEFDRLSQQGTNDASSIKERVRIISRYLGLPQLEFN